MLQLSDVLSAAETIRPTLSPTPCRPSRVFSDWFGQPVNLKLENLQPTGSFKERGACVRLEGLTPAERAAGVITASAGNHAQAVASHARRLGVPAVLVMPLHTPLIKVNTVRELGGQVVLFGQSFDEAYAEAERRAAEQGMVFVSAFDNDDVIRGQGTCGLEIVSQVPEVGTILVPVGGGGLIGGVALAVKSLRPGVRIVGVEAEGYSTLLASLSAGGVVAAPGAPPIADGIAVKRVSERTLSYARTYVDEVVTVDEETIARSVLILLERHKTLAEGAAAAPLGALLAGRVSLTSPTVLLISGGNIDSSRLDDIICRGLAADGRRVRLQAVMPDVPGQLHRLTGVLADLEANVLDVLHDRPFGDAGMGQTETTLTLETRGEEHIAQILSALAEAGFMNVQRVAAAARGGGVGRVAAY
ncbi:MAG: threonine ammonia-lyase [Armatimonadetes bacterium]|nr:threonine ammonia-lyase [Armatimonadota bacterium]